MEEDIKRKANDAITLLSIERFIAKYLKPKDLNETKFYMEEYIRTMMEVMEELKPGVKDILKAEMNDKEAKNILFPEKQ